MVDVIERLGTIRNEIDLILNELNNIPSNIPSKKDLAYRIIGLVCDEYGVVYSRANKPPLPEVRLLTWKICMNKNIPKNIISEVLGGVSESTMRSYKHQYNNLYIEDEVFQNTIKKISRKLVK